MATVYVTMASATATQAMKVKCVKNQLERNVRMDAHLTAVATWASAGVNQDTKAMTARN